MMPPGESSPLGGQSMADLLRLSMVAAKLDSQTCLSPHLLSPCLSHQLLEPPFLLENMANSQLQGPQHEISSGNEFILVLHLEKNEHHR